ncbi:TPA: radical SAM protein [Legionella anisa]
MNTNFKNVSLYNDWEKNTAKLCEIGEEANKFIEKKYFASDYLDFFSAQSDTALDFEKISSYRHQFWLNHPLRSKRIQKWLSELNYFITTSLQANNKLGLLKEFVWAKFSTLPILISLSNELKEDNSKDINKIIELLQAVEASLKNNNTPSCDILLIERKRLPTEIVKIINKQRFLNVYQITLPKLKKNIFCEVIETWNFNKNEESINISLPLSIGCVASCKMCEFSLFKPINIPISMLTQIIDYQVRNNYEAPFTDKPKYTLYYLGGGDALQYKALPELLTYVSKLLDNPDQVISTIAFGTPISFKSFLEKISNIPNIKLQWSLNAFNDTNREFITGCTSLIPVATCIDLLEQYSKKTKRKVTISIMPFKEGNEDNKNIKTNILHYLNPNVFRINFANIQPNNLEFSKQNSHHILTKELYEWAIENKYEATIDSPIEQDNQLALCGRASSTVSNGNQPYLKEGKNGK